jgi:hypothetical protein
MAETLIMPQRNETLPHKQAQMSLQLAPPDLIFVSMRANHLNGRELSRHRDLASPLSASFFIKESITHSLREAGENIDSRLFRINKTAGVENQEAKLCPWSIRGNVQKIG